MIDHVGNVSEHVPRVECFLMETVLETPKMQFFAFNVYIYIYNDNNKISLRPNLTGVL